MSLANQPAFARPGFGPMEGESQEGMTFRQYAAVHILAGLRSGGHAEEQVHWAVKITDQLIAELEKPAP